MKSGIIPHAYKPQNLMNPFDPIEVSQQLVPVYI